MELKRLITLFIFSIVVTSAFSDTPSPSDEEDGDDDLKEIPVEQKSDDKNNSRHRMPSLYNPVTCYYHNGLLYVSFEYSDGQAILNLYGLPGYLCDSRSFSTATTFIYHLDSPSEPLRIEIIKGSNCYEGWLI